MRILIIGSTGFIGQHLTKRLPKGHEFFFLNLPDSKRKKTPNSITGDITHLESILTATKNIDIVINLAAPITQDEELNQRIIVGGSQNLIQAAKQNHIKKIIHLSSLAAYRKNLDNYGKAKKQADEIYQKTKNLNVVLLKPAMVYGREGYAFQKFLSSITKVPFLVLVIGDGKYRIQPVFVEDIVTCILKAITYKKPGVHLLDVAGPEMIKYDDLVKKILAILGKKKYILHLPLKFVLALVGFITFFLRKVAFNKTTIKRMVEEVPMDIKKTEKELGMKFTDYDKGLSTVLKSKD